MSTILTPATVCHEPRSPAGGGDAAAGTELRRLAGPLFAALERSALPMVVTDPRRHDNPIVFVNAAFVAMTGYESRDLLGQNWRILQGPATDPAAVAEIDAAASAGRELHVEILNYRKDGAAFWSETFITPVANESGETAFLLSSQLDVTAARAARAVAADLRMRQDRLQRINDGLQTALAISRATATWEWDIGNHRIIGDAGFAALIGVAAEAASAGVPPGAFFANIHPEDRDRIRIAVGGILRGAEVFAKSYRIIVEGTSVRWVLARGHCAYDEHHRQIGRAHV